MFLNNKNQPVFGTATTASPFGIGTNASANQTAFGGSSLFGSPSNFGTSPPLFASTPPNPQGVFSNTDRPAQQAAFGGNLFNPQLNASGSPFRGSGFVQQNKNFGFAFGSTPTASPEQRGSAIKFTPPMATDVVVRKGVECTVNTRLNNIVCMKEYSAKSQEELRLEDYEVNRKGPQQGSSAVPPFGNLPSPFFGQTENKAFFGQTNNSPRFGQVENKPMFGQTANPPSFGQAENKLFGQTTSFTNQPREQFGQQFSSFGLNTPQAKPFGFAATGTSPKPFASPTMQSSFNVPNPAANISQPVAFGNSAFGQTTGQAPNLDLFNKPSQPSFNFSQMGQNSFQNNSFQAPQPAFNFPSIGKTDAFGRPASNTSLPSAASNTSLPSAGKIELPSFGQPTIASQPVQNPFGALQGSMQFPSAQPLPSLVGTGMQSLTNNFMSLHKPTDTTCAPLAPRNGFMVPQQQPQFASLARSEEPDNFYTIVDKVYESFPYRSVFDGISVELYMDEQATNPRMLHKIVEEESLPISSIDGSTKLRMLTGPEPRQYFHPEKYKWLPGTDYTTNYNNFVLNKKTKHLTLSKNQSPREDQLKKLLPHLTDGDIRHHILEQLNTDTKAPEENLQDTVQNSPCEIVAASNEEETTENWEEELPSILKRYYKLKKVSRPKEEDCNNNGMLAPAKEVLFDESAVEQQSSQSTTPPSTSSSREDVSDTRNSNSDDETPPCAITPPSIQSSLKALLIKDGDFKTDLQAKLFMDRLQNIIKNLEIPIAANELVLDEPGGSGDTAPGIPPSDTCGIKLTRKDYYIIPPLEEICKYRTEEGQCIVKGFTVGRHGFGSVYFPDKMDVSNLDLDEIIQFHFHEATVYSDDTQKPQVGQGLNRPGQVTLERVWPRHPITRKILRDPETINAVNFVERLTLLSLKQDAVFVDYRPDTGSWVFRVEHFSKFNFTESDEEEVDLADKLEQELEIKKKRRVEGNSLDGDGNLQKPMPRRSLSQERLTSVLEGDVRNVMMLKCSFFDGLTCNGTPNLETVWDVSMDPLSATVNRSVWGVRKKLLTCSPKYNVVLNSNHVVPKGRSLIVPSKHSCTSGGLFKGRSFKTCWGPGFSFITAGGSVSELPSMNGYHEDASKTVESLKLGDLSSNPQMMYLKEHLNVVFAESTVTLENSQLPLFTVNENHRTLISHHNVAESSDLDFSISFSHYRQVWDLCLALWGPETTTPTNRLELFSKWLEDATFPSVKSELKHPATIADVFIYLTGHKITEAAELADQLDLPHLSVLITQASGQESAKQLMWEQLEQWNNIGILQKMDKDVVKVYMLLAGIPYLSEVNVCDGLDWRRALGVYFWYMCPAGTSLINALQVYQRAFVSGFASAPTPEWYEYNGMVYDVLYQMMVLFAVPTMPLEKVVNPTTYTDDPLDYRLSWFLLQVFAALKLGTVSQQVINSLHVSFSSQLEHLGLWEWAVYVLLFIKDKSYKTNAVMEVLQRHLDLEQTTPIPAFLVNCLKIPSEWIHSVLASKSRIMGNYLETYRHLILAENWVESGKVAVERLIPDFVVTGQLGDLSQLLKALIPGKGDILQWDTEIGLVVDYVEFNQRVTNNIDGFTMLEIRQLQREVTGLCFRIKDFPTTSPKLKVAAAELSKFLVDLMKLLYCQLLPANVKNVRFIVNLVQGLPMPPDYKQNVLQEMCSSVIKN